MSDILVSWVILGSLAGLLVYLFSPRKIPGGLFTNLLIGIVGAALGGYLIAGVTGTDFIRGALTWGSVIVTSLAAVMILLMLQSQAYRPSSTPPKKN